MTKFETNLPTVIEELQAKDVELEAKAVDLQNQINREVVARTDADTKLQANIDAETNARAITDKDLQDQITAEVTARVEGDKKLQVNINAEADTRKSADQDLQAQIDALKKTGCAPTGAVEYFAMLTAPEGWLEADGAAVSRTQYVDLFTAIGTTFGTGDGSTTFNLPDLRGEFIRGWAHNRTGTTDDGRIFGSNQTDSIQTFKIAPIDKSTGLSINYFDVSFGPRVGGGSIQCYTIHQPQDNAPYQLRPVALDNTQTIRQSNETRSRNIALLPCIKI